jgi:O-antigen ligase
MAFALRTLALRMENGERRPLPFAALADWLAAGVAASLPWSTSATGILVVLWLLALLPTLEPQALPRELRTAAGGLPVLLCLLAAVGMAWADAPWPERLAGLGGFLKLLAIPFLLAHFRRSDKGPLVLAAFVVACTVLLATSYVIALWPGLTFRGVRAGLGVPVKDYIAQSGEFALCLFILLPIALDMLRRRPWPAVALLGLAALFAVNFLYLATGRTALAVTVVLLALFALRQFGWRKGCLLLGAAMLMAALVWESSPYLRLQVGRVPGEIARYWNENARTATGERLEFWRRSISFIAAAPVLGHGTGSVRELFRRSAVGEEGAAAAIVSGNPHNQTLAIAIQLGLVGVVLLYAMWVAHLALFCASGTTAWIGLAVVVQNMVASLFNSHLFDFTQGWIYVVGVGVAGGTLIAQPARSTASREAVKQRAHA